MNLRLSFFVAMIGACMGSFLTCLTSRFIDETNILTKRSYCDTCKHQLSIFDLLPLISYLLLKGKCRYCHKSINKFYFYNELSCSLIYQLIFIKYGNTLLTIKYLILISILIVISYVDFKKYIIPDSLIILGILNCLIFMDKDLLNNLISSLIVTSIITLLVLIMNRINSKEMMGGGDLKLILMLGLYVSLFGDVIAIELASLLALIYIFVKNKQKEVIAFGPFIALAYLLVILIDNNIK